MATTPSLFEIDWVDVQIQKPPIGVDVLFFTGVVRCLGQRQLKRGGGDLFLERVKFADEFEYKEMRVSPVCWTRLPDVPEKFTRKFS